MKFKDLCLLPIVYYVQCFSLALHVFFMLYHVTDIKYKERDTDRYTNSILVGGGGGS
jgi:hypothetical protein